MSIPGITVDHSGTSPVLPFAIKAATGAVSSARGGNGEPCRQGEVSNGLTLVAAGPAARDEKGEGTRWPPSPEAERLEPAGQDEYFHDVCEDDQMANTDDTPATRPSRQAARRRA